jgi:phosphocarrier protein HPr
MKSFTYVIKDKEGIHARPAGIIAGEAKKFTSKVTMKNKGKEADLTRILRVMALCVKSGEEVVIEVEGPDEEACAASLKKAFEENL